MSKERARRRAAREAAAAAAAVRNTERQRRAARRRALWDRLLRPFHSRRTTSIQARRRRAQNSALLGVFLVIQLLAWLFLHSWQSRLATFGLSLFLLPVLATLLFDRRS